MRKYSYRTLLLVAFLSSACSMVSAASLKLNSDLIEFLGVHCQMLSADDIALDSQGQLQIDLSQLAALTTPFQSRDCTVKIPYTTSGELVNSHVSISGRYKTRGKELFLTTVRIAEAGRQADAAAYQIKKSPQGEFRWSQPFQANSGEKSQKTLKIVFSLVVTVLADDSTSFPSEATGNGASTGGSHDELNVQPLKLVIDNVTFLSEETL